MSKQYPGGIISKTAPVPSGPYSDSTAPGIWTLDQQAAYAKLGQWPTAGNLPPDAQFNYVTMLLHGDGTNGAQNNTFLDSSTNNFTITRNGNTTQGSFSPYGPVGNWSTNFNGSSQNLYTPSTTALNVGSGNFTIECFFNVSAFNGANILRGGNQYNFALLLSGTSVIYYLSTTGSSWDLAGGLTAGSGLSAGTWNHLALVRNGNTFTPYLNGVAGTTSSSASALAVLNGFNIGAEQNAVAGGTFNGFISNVRVVVGTAVYTSNFTPPIAPLTAVSGTQLLACQNNRFIDNSSNNFTFTTAGTPRVQRFNPFGASTAYSTSVIGGSGYFDGSGDYLNTPSSSQFTASGDFTVSCWFYLQSFANAYYVVGGNWNSATSDEWLIQIANDGSIRFLTTASTSFSATGLVKLNQWIYFTATRSGTTVTVQLNGTTVSTYTKSDTLGAASKTINIGQQVGGSWPFNGYISDFRLLSGSAITTVPTAPVSSTSTGLLLSFTNGAIFDNAMMNDLETVGNAQISTSVVKYGTGSLYFDGTGDGLIGQNTPNISLSGNFTIEAWVYQTNAGQNAPMISIGDASTSNGIVLYINTSQQLAYFINSAGTASGSAPINTWHHIAVVRSGSTITTYLNGVGQNVVTYSATFSGAPYFGAIVYSSVTYYGAGYMDDLRITKGYARYTVDFTPPTAAFSNFGPT